MGRKVGRILSLRNIDVRLRSEQWAHVGWCVPVIKQDGSQRRIEAAGGPVDEWLALTEAPESATRLAETTAAAEARGVFGVPSLFLDDELFWGLDSLPAFEWRIASGRRQSEE